MICVQCIGFVAVRVGIVLVVGGSAGDFIARFDHCIWQITIFCEASLLFQLDFGENRGEKQEACVGCDYSLVESTGVQGALGAKERLV